MKIISERRSNKQTTYSIEFDRKGEGCCEFSFACDANGILLPDTNACALDNYKKCTDGTYDVVPKGIVKYTNSWIEPAVGICDICKEDVALTDAYHGSCQCSCGQWYSVYGAQLLPPDQWEEAIDM